MKRNTYIQKITVLLIASLLILLVPIVFSPKVYVKNGDYYTHFILVGSEFTYLRIINDCKDGLIKNSDNDTVECERHHSLKRDVFQKAEDEQVLFESVGLETEKYDEVWDLYKDDEVGPKLTLALSESEAYFVKVGSFVRAGKLTSWHAWFLAKLQFVLQG